MNEVERKLWQPLPTFSDRLQHGKERRNFMSRKAHGSFEPHDRRPDPVQLIIESNKDRIPDLIPIRHQRMLQSAFAFYRGTANVMAEDLAHILNTGIYVQSCGDCHLFNFGGYATPERKQVFDINDFDETLPAPFEWDLKRLAASIVLAGRFKGHPDKLNRKAAFEAMKMYAVKMRKYSTMRQLEIWYSCLDKETIYKQFKDEKEFVWRFKVAAKKAKLRTQEHLFPKISEIKDGKRKIIDEPPYIYHLPDTEQIMETSQEFFDNYYRNLSDDKKTLMNRFRLVDVAMKVVGVGSVGTRCLIALFIAEGDDAMFLQFKEASSSVLEKHLGKTIYDSNGARIVNGQKLMQTVSDIFLGWSTDRTGRQFYIRQLRDMKANANIENFTPGIFTNYAVLCGWSLAKSHAKSGMSPEITGYIGTDNTFANALADFAVLYADQAEKDYQSLRRAAENNIIQVPEDVSGKIFE